MQEICERYGIPYNTGPLLRQFGTVVRKIVRLTFPDSWVQKAGAENGSQREPAAA